MAAELVKNNTIRVDVYEASSKIEAIGSGITLWGRVCEALQLMGLDKECSRSSEDMASSSGVPAGRPSHFPLPIMQ